jgi:riboflavin biosynthesis pyrimidine reductase
MHQIRTLVDRCSSAQQPLLPAGLRSAYDGDLWLPPAAAAGTHVVANFASTLDGIASFKIPGKSGGGEISGFNEADRFIMGLLRSSADAVLFGSGSLREDPGHVRTAQFICPALAEALGSFRQDVLHKPIYPLSVVLTGTGVIDLGEPTFHTPELPSLIITTEAGLTRLQRDHGKGLAVTQIRTARESAKGVSPQEAVRILRGEFGIQQLLHEGGPTLFAQFLAAGLVDELFLTLAPQIAGRDPAQPRPGIADKYAFLPNQAPWFELMSVRMAQNHLYLRYAKPAASGKATAPGVAGPFVQA